MKVYAYSLEGQPPEKWQPLEEHLRAVARQAAEFAKPFGGEDWAYVARLKHPFGVSAEAFLYRLEELDLIAKPPRDRLPLSPFTISTSVLSRSR